MGTFMKGVIMNVNQIHVYTDGACSGNPGPAGIGIVLNYNSYKKEISKYIGNATNNIAELTAIKVGLEAIKPLYRTTPVIIYTDSAYCHGLFTKDWNPKKNIELIMDIRSLIVQFSDIEFKHVKGHSDNPGNNKADILATSAIQRTKK
jgi:ribonuclease HI